MVTYKRGILFFVMLSALLFAKEKFILPSHSAMHSATLAPTMDLAADSVVNVIVEFKEEPFYIAQGSKKFSAASTSFYQSRFSEFQNTLHTSAFSKAAGSPQGITVRKEFYKLFFGEAISLPQQMIPMIEQLSYVKKVSRESIVQAHLEKSIPHIRANEVWNNLGIRGDSVVVGIIDSGIDYMHPALGGGIGPSFKVVGGYDFVNHDSDPMDDNGHGTHVAGIVAADGATIQGVAPKAKLVAYKVLNDKGQGNSTDIIEAIERTVDPNQDGDTSDKLDVVNMSLGSNSGSPDDAMSITVDNAVKLGVTFCVSAGNSGGYTPTQGKEDNYYFTGMETIASPGTARLAITVGAIDSVNTVPRFSSKGPAPLYYAIKPDVAAPGVNIRSLAPGNSYAYLSGTSMASPMIAGVAALLKSNNKSLTPSQIKSAIVNSAVDLGAKKMLQGSGRVDAFRSIQRTSFAVPSQLSYGLDDPSQGIWTKVETVQVTNTKNIAQNYSVAFSGTVSGISVSTSPQNFSLSQNETKNVFVTITVDNGIIPIVDQDIPVYDGFVRINGSSDTLHLPWAFARTTRMFLTFSDPNPIFLGASKLNFIQSTYNRWYSRVRWIDAKTLEVTGGSYDTYNFALYFPTVNKLITKENVAVNGTESIHFTSSDAVHTIFFDGADNTGTPFTSSNAVKRVLRVNLPTNFPLFIQLPADQHSIMVSPSSNNFQFHAVEAMIDLRQAKKIVIPQYIPFTGISGDRHLSPPSAYTSQKLHFKTAPNAPHMKIYSEVIYVQSTGGNDYFNTVIVGIDTLAVSGDTASFDMYLMKSSDSTASISPAFYIDYSNLATDFVDYSTRYFSIVNDSVMANLPSQNSLTAYKSPDGGEMFFGSSPVHLLNLTYNNEFGTSIHFSPHFLGGLNEERYADYDFGSYTIYNDAGQLLKEAPLSLDRSPFAVPPAKYRVTIMARNYFVKNVEGRITLTNAFDLTKQVPDSPIITSLVFLNSKKQSVDQFAKNENATIQFSSLLYSYVTQLPIPDSTTIMYRKYKTMEWIPLPVTHVGDQVDKGGSLFSASLAAATAVDSVAIDLKIRMVDQSGNSTEQILSPAFSVGNWINDGSTEVEPDIQIPASYSLVQNYPNPFNPATTIEYEVPRLEHVSIVVYDIVGREVTTLVNGTHMPGKYKTVFNAGALSSGVYFYRLKGGNFHTVKKMVVMK